ncbi:MAG: hypothetical protein HDR01_00140 [Lachnospiraceae bacterium]|nr:hypothetical protein [Lachnospiraceae bacterium]
MDFRKNSTVNKKIKIICNELRLKSTNNMRGQMDIQYVTFTHGGKYGEIRN